MYLYHINIYSTCSDVFAIQFNIAIINDILFNVCISAFILTMGLTIFILT